MQDEEDRLIIMEYRIGKVAEKEARLRAAEGRVPVLHDSRCGNVDEHIDWVTTTWVVMKNKVAPGVEPATGRQGVERYTTRPRAVLSTLDHLSLVFLAPTTIAVPWGGSRRLRRGWTRLRFV